MNAKRTFLFRIIALGATVVAIIIGFALYSDQISSHATSPEGGGTSTASITPISNANNNSSVNNLTDNNNSSSQGSQGKEQTHASNGIIGSSTIQVAFVRPTFTYAAYQLNGFYNFYHKYSDTPKGTNVTTDLNLLTVKVPHRPVLGWDDKPSDPIPLPREKEYIDSLIQHVENKAPARINVKVSDITDKEVHDGLIFSRNGSNNAYNILLLFHQEYVTQSEYDNLKKFVANGGTIVFNDANIFTVQVNYNSANDTIKFIRGHTWQYDGKSAAWRAERERWANETQLWVGSNFLQDPTKDKVIFTNDPWSYKHSEEQYVTNPKDKIIFDFGAKEYESTIDKTPQYGNATNNSERVAIYQLDYGKGKVISLSIFSYKLRDNEDFLNFYDKEIIPRTFAGMHQYGSKNI